MTQSASEEQPATAWVLGDAEGAGAGGSFAGARGGSWVQPRMSTGRSDVNDRTSILVSYYEWPLDSKSR